MEQNCIKIKTQSQAELLTFKAGNAKVGDWVLVETKLGQELGKVIAVEKTKTEKLQNILRVATSKDIESFNAIKQKAIVMLEETKGIIKKLKLEMKAFDAFLTFDEKKFLVYFTAENRVDFRELVKIMANTFKKRIELHQVGVRDQVQRVGSVGICGKECCCHGFLDEFNHVSIKMAKNQGLSLMPNNIMGACGKLLCCLEYENQEYVEMIKAMPQINSLVITPDGKGKVMFNNIIKKTTQVQVGDDIKTYPYEILKVIKEKNHGK